MNITDFIETGNKKWHSKEKYFFKNDKFVFKYTWIIDVFEYQPGSDVNKWNTRYTAMILIDKESRHETRKDDFLEEELYTYTIKKRETNMNRFDEKYLSKFIEDLENIDIDTKIKKNKYQKINGIINGENFMVI